MSTPGEKRSAINLAHLFLQGILNLETSHLTFDELANLKRNARQALRHFPLQDEISIVHPETKEPSHSFVPVKSYHKEAMELLHSIHSTLEQIKDGQHGERNYD